MSFLTENIIPLFALNPKDWPTREYKGDTIEIKDHLEIHSRGKWSPAIMDMVRPNEDPAATQHREQVFKSPVKPYFQKAINNFAKIQIAEDWEIKFKSDSLIEKQYKDYCTKSFPYDDSVENFVFNVLLKTKFEDPNAVCVVSPLRKPTKDTDYFKPSCWIYPSERVIFAADNEYYVLEDEEKSEVYSGDRKLQEGIILRFVSQEEIIVLEQFGEKSDYKFSVNESKSFIHKFGYVPAFKLGGVPCKTNFYERIYESPLSPALDMWDEATRRYSDKQVNWILHMNPERWEVQDTECKTCNGSGVEAKKFLTGKSKGNEYTIKCSSCNGLGKVGTRSPYNVKLTRVGVKEGLSEAMSVPNPPMGYIDRDTRLIELQGQEVKENIYQGLACLNLEHLMEAPLSTSGVSKAYDRQEAHALVYDVMVSLIEDNFDPIYEFIARWMFSNIVSEEGITDLMPFINKAKKLDFISNSTLQERAEKANEAGFSSALVSSLQLQYAKYDLGEDSTEYKMLKAVYDLNPFADNTMDEKMAMAASGSIDKDMLILSDNISMFVKKAYNENRNFYDLDYNQQMEIMNKYIQEVKSKIKSDIIPINEP